MREELTKIIKDHGEKKNKPKRELREINGGGNPAESKRNGPNCPQTRKEMGFGREILRESSFD